ncbi:hypothetical protein [Staphylococcus edaphicus]|uniref:Stress protein n=1 Tax=Staphylococcus edaphicus TaxID=1955013 RepID=A0A2C6WK88_9STAP|nr:hypothetical protein [Staphylococcus edaphicus]PHK48573.1 hypothetical protein BTJ66_12960 [Staphylococcus edaphicus]UQW81453.1 hypothetical protein MNY58_12990 [Staphylococcus edaphicus]
MKRIIFLFIVASLLFVACGKSIAVKQVIQSFKDHHLHVSNVKDMDKEDFGAAPMKAKEAKIFEVEKNKNARIMRFTSDDDLKETKQYYDELGKSSAILYSHTYVKNNYLLQMNGDIADSTFEKYKKVLNQTLD